VSKSFLTPLPIVEHCYLSTLLSIFFQKMTKMLVNYGLIDGFPNNIYLLETSLSGINVAK
jgi:hypothetical protein